MLNEQTLLHLKKKETGQRKTLFHLVLLLISSGILQLAYKSKKKKVVYNMKACPRRHIGFKNGKLRLFRSQKGPHHQHTMMSPIVLLVFRIGLDSRNLMGMEGALHREVG